MKPSPVRTIVAIPTQAMANVREAMDRGGSPRRQIEFHLSIPHLIKDVGISCAPLINDQAKNVSDATERLNQTENVSVCLIRSFASIALPYRVNSWQCFIRKVHSKQESDGGD